MKDSRQNIFITGAKGTNGKKSPERASKNVKARETKKPERKRQPETLQIAADGRKRAVLKIQLPANAVVDQFDLTLTAKRAELVKAMDVADLRPADDATSPSLVVDFGALRTINAVLLPTHHSNHKVYPWLGTQFDSTGLDLPNTGVKTVNRSQGASAYKLHYYPIPETRTERLRIELGNADAQLESVLQTLELSLPELPADLGLRINGGAPVWEHSGTVQLSSSDELDENGWTKQGQRRVSIAGALQPFAGDATSSELIDLTLELTSNVPGVLNIAAAAKKIRLLHRLRFDQRDELNMVFDGEGEQQLFLSNPEGIKTEIMGVTFSLKGEFPLERVLPPLGPVPNQISELSLGGGRAACVRLDGGEGLASLTAVRFPLESKGSSAEARVVLWRDQGGLPVETLDEAVSEPVNFSDSGEQWITFALNEPVPFNPATPLWAALIVTRGEVTWKMATANTRGDNPIRLGAPEGPWRALPAIFGAGTTLGSVAGRVHIAGLADESQPLAPLLIFPEGSTEGSALTPGKTQQVIQMEFPTATVQKEPLVSPESPLPQDSEQLSALDRRTIVLEEQYEPVLEGRMLRIISRSAGAISLSAIDVITADEQGDH